MSGIARSQCPPEFLIDGSRARAVRLRPRLRHRFGGERAPLDVFNIVETHETKTPTRPAGTAFTSLPHELYLPAADAIHRKGRSPGNGWTRIGGEAVRERLPSARAMHASLKEHRVERDLYRIDRYLGKEVMPTYW